MAHADGSLSKSEYLKERRLLLQQWLNSDASAATNDGPLSGLVSESRYHGMHSANETSGNRLIESLATAEDISPEESRRRAAEQILRAAKESGADNLQHPDDTIFLSRGAVQAQPAKHAERKTRPRYQSWLWVVAILSVLASASIVIGVWGPKGSWLPDLVRSVFSSIT